MPDFRGADYFEQIALGNLPNDRTFLYKFGRNPIVGATEVIISEGGVYGLPPTAETVTCTSTDGNDVPAGSGAQSIHIFGLDADYNLVSEIVDIGVSTTQTFLRIYRVHVESAGTITPIGGGNVGTLTVTQDTSAIEMVKIAPGDSQTLVACYTVPAGYSALVWSADTTTGEGKNATNRLKTREINNNAPFRTKGIRDNFENTVGIRFKIPNIYEEKTDIVFTSVSTAAGTPVSATFLLELVKND